MRQLSRWRTRPEGFPCGRLPVKKWGVSFGAPTTNNHSAPNVTITLNGAESDSERCLRQIAGKMFEDVYIDFQSRMQRVGVE